MVLQNPDITDSSCVTISVPGDEWMLITSSSWQWQMIYLILKALQTNHPQCPTR